MSGMDRLDDAALDNIVHGNSICTMAHVQRMARELLAHRRASQAAPAPSDALREAEPNYCFNPEDWEYTQSWDARDELAESILDYARNEGPIRVSTLISGPDKWVARISLDTDGDGEADDWEYQWFDSEEAARAALSTPTEERK